MAGLALDSDTSGEREFKNCTLDSSPRSRVPLILRSGMQHPFRSLSGQLLCRENTWVSCRSSAVMGKGRIQNEKVKRGSEQSDCDSNSRDSELLRLSFISPFTSGIFDI